MDLIPTATPRGRRVAAVCAAVALAAGAAVAAAPTGAGAATGWAATATKAFGGDYPLAHATLLGAAQGSTPLRLTIGLTPRDRAGLDALIREQGTRGSAEYGKYLTPTQFTSRFAATAATARTVSSYLSKQGMTHVTVAPNRLQVTADATAAEAEKAFNTSISRFRQSGATVLANTAAAYVPASMTGMVTGVLGLSSFGASPTATPTAPKLTGFYPKEFSTVYNAKGTTAGNGSTLAVIAEGNLAPTVTDLRTAETKQGLPKVPVNLRYAGAKSADTSGADEWDLDTQTSTGVAPNAKALDIYVATSLSDADLANSLNKFASEDVAQSGSASLGECDVVPYLTGATKVDDMIFAEAAAQGQTFFASSGDTGSACAVLPTNGVPGAGVPDTEYPASSPYVVGVGGTTLLADGTTDAYQSEISWNAGGGGISPVEKAPAWQSGVVPTSKLGLRGVPDVAFDADPTTGANIYVGGAPETIGGTSLSSPLALGLWTRLQSSHADKLGFAAPKLYAYYTKTQNGTPTTAVPGFHDVTVGANGLYTALPGYDYTTGLGSWDVTTLSSKLG